MSKEPEKVPVWHKYVLSLPEACEYFGIGYKKLRSIVEANRNADFVLWNGTRPQIKRCLFEQYIDKELTAI